MGLGGKSDIMPCNLFLRFSEPRQEERSTKHPVMQRCRRDGGLGFFWGGGSRTRGRREQEGHFHSFDDPHTLKRPLREDPRALERDINTGTCTH